MGDRLSFAGSIEKKAAGQVRGDGVGEELIEVGVLDARSVHTFVLDVPHEPAGRALPPGEVGLQADGPPAVQTELAAARKNLRAQPQGLPQRGHDEGLENRVHVDQEGRGRNVAVVEIEGDGLQDQPREVDGRPIVLVEPIPGDLRKLGGVIVAQGYPFQRAPQPAEARPRVGGAQLHSFEPVARGPDHAVGLDVLGELVVRDLHGWSDTEAAPELIVEAYPPPHTGQRGLFAPVALEQATPKGLPDLVNERGNQGFEKGFSRLEEKRGRTPGARVERVGKEEQDPVDVDLGPDLDRQLRQVQSSDRRAGSEIVQAVCAACRDHGHRWREQAKGVSLLRRQRDRRAHPIFDECQGLHEASDAGFPSRRSSAKSRSRPSSPKSCSATKGRIECSQTRRSFSSSRSLSRK